MDEPGTGQTGTDQRQDLDPLPISLLDFLSFRPEHGATALREAGLRSAQLADRLGYRRFWIPEHHQRGVPSTNPVMLLPALGVLTKRIRLGTAVSLIRIRDPYLLAEDLATAAHFCRDRLDVGLGRGDVRGDADPDGAPALRRWPEDELRTRSPPSWPPPPVCVRCSRPSSATAPRSRRWTGCRRSTASPT